MRKQKPTDRSRGLRDVSTALASPLISIHALLHLRDPAPCIPFLVLPESWMDSAHGGTQCRFKAQFYQVLAELISEFYKIVLKIFFLNKAYENTL